MDKNYQFFMRTKLDSYIGEWIAICNERIVSHGKDVKKVFQEARERCPRERPLLTRVPDKETMIFYTRRQKLLDNCCLLVISK